MSESATRGKERVEDEARVPREKMHDDADGFAVTSDYDSSCTLREGHDVQFVAVAPELPRDAPKILELNCADPYCDEHAHPYSIAPEVSADDQISEISHYYTMCEGEYDDADGLYVGSGVLRADFDTGTFGLTDVTLEHADEAAVATNP